MKPYKPHGDTEKILDAAYEMVESVPYQVSLRWLFYRLLQAGYYSKKSDYKTSFMPVFSKIRKREYRQWTPDTLVDDRREAVKRGDGLYSEKRWLKAVAKMDCNLDKWNSQPNYVELWFEANAMAGQFKYHTKYITLRAMGGQPSIPYKYQAAKDLEQADYIYEKPIVILYFGDLDDGGKVIGDVIEREVRGWCKVPFQFVRSGLTAEQVAKYGIPENPEKRGCYQWESLDDEAAREIITNATSEFVSHDLFSKVEARERKLIKWFRETLNPLLETYDGENADEVELHIDDEEDSEEE